MGQRWTRSFAVAAMLAGAAVMAPISAQASAAGWGTVPFPASPSYYSPTVSSAFYSTNSVAADALGNIYYVPNGSCSGSGGPSVRSPLARGSRAVQGHVQSLATSTDGPGCGIEQYNPATGAMLQLAPLMDFQAAFGVAVDPSGNVFVLNWDGTIYEISGGVVSTFESVSQAPVFNTSFLCGAIGIAVNATDQLFVTTWDCNTFVGSVYEVTSSGATPALLASANAGLGSIAVAPDGTVYTTAITPNTRTVYKLTATGSLVPFGTGWANPQTVTVDGAGNVYVADEYNGVVTEITPSGAQFNLPTDRAGATSQPAEVFYGGGTVYLWDANEPNPGNVLYTWSLGASHVTTLSATAIAVSVNGRETQSVTASWTGGASSYRCTLLYGYNDPTSFTATTSAPSCTFSNLALGVGWGVSVVALSNGVASAPSVVFTSPATFTITCVYRATYCTAPGRTRRCPLRWRQRA